MNLRDLTDHLRNLRGIQHKLDIRPVRGWIGDLSQDTVPNGDDCAAIVNGDGHLLFAIEGLLDEFVAAEPWFAGYCAVMVSVSDVYAMGGRPLAVVDALWTNCADRAGPIWDGMTAAARKYGVPIVGGHTNSKAVSDHLAAAVLGRAGKNLLTSFDATPSDAILAVFDLRGEWFGPHPYWNASTTAEGARLRGDLEILPRIAEAGLCAAAKDVSMGGLIGTVTMLAECSGVGATIDVSRVPIPPGIPLEKWLACFPSYGFILAVKPQHIEAVSAQFAARHLTVATVGDIDATATVKLTEGTDNSEIFWDLNVQSFIGFGPVRAERTT